MAEEDHDEDEALARQQAHAVAEAVPELEVFGTQLVSRDEALPVTVDLYGTWAELNVAYWEGTTERVAPIVARVARRLAHEGPFLVFDPQEGELIEPDAVRAAFREQHPRGAAIAKRIVRRTPPWHRRPWFKRMWKVASTVAIVAVVFHRLGVY